MPLGEFLPLENIFSKFGFTQVITRYNSFSPGDERKLINLGEKFNEKEDAQIVAMAEAMQEEGSLALRATGAISDDGIIDPRDTRMVLGMCLSVVNGKEVEGAPGYGVYRL